MPSSQLLAATPNGGYTTSSRQLKRRARQCNRSLMKIMSISFAFSYLLSCHAFHSASSWSFTSSAIATGAPSRTSYNIMITHPSSREWVGRQFLTTAVVVQGKKDNVEMEHDDFRRNLAKCYSNSRLFPPEQSSTRRRGRRMQPNLMMMMAVNDSSPMSDKNLSNKVSSHSPLHLKVWNSLRNILARLWVSTCLSPSDNYSASPGLTQHLNS